MAYWRACTPAEAAGWCRTALAQGRVIEVGVQGADGVVRRSFAWPDVVAQVIDAPEQPGRVRVLSPFDPVLRDRNRAERLFGFRYRIEVFVPEPKRQFGYYVFPVLEGAQIIGRVDTKAHRADSVLRVRAFWPEPGVGMGRGRRDQLEAELARLATFSGCERVEMAGDWLREPVKAEM